MAQKKNSKKSTKKSNGALFTTACVVLGLLVILIVFLVKKDQIFTNLKETAFFDKVFGTTPELIEKHEPAAPKQQETIPLKEDVVIQIEPEKKASPKPVESTPAKTEKTVEQSASVEKTEKITPKEEPKKETPKVTAKTELQLCFVVIDGDGSVGRKTVKRSVPKPDSPLTTAINLLLQGPDATLAAEKNCMSVIPKGTKLLSAKVKDGVAYLSFNDKLEYNELGVEGTIHSLEQIVYTATSFSTVSSVQILIEGEKREYLGSEGQWIGSPLSRQSF